MKQITLTSAVAVLCLLPTPSIATCIGNRIKCAVVGANDALSCANYVHEGCQWDEYSNQCVGDPLKECKDFTTSGECFVHPNCAWQGTDGDGTTPHSSQQREH